jgi:hypothetical protein
MATATPAVPSFDPAGARDSALVYVIGHYGEQAPAPGLSWVQEFIRPDGGLAGAGTYQYTAKDRVVAISYRILPVVYQVVVADQATGFHWEGLNQSQHSCSR